MNEMMIAIFALFCIFIVPAIVVIIIVFVIARLISGRNPRQDKAATAEEARLIQEIYQGLQKMDRRIETLETLLLENEGKDQINERQSNPL